MALGILLPVGSISDDEHNSPRFGGAGGDRTLYLFNAIEALSRVSYSPIP